MCPKLRQPSKEKSQILIARLKKQLSVTQKTIARLEKVLPGYLYFPQKGHYGLMWFNSTLEELEKDVIDFPDKYV